MKVLPFNIPVTLDKTVIVKEEVLPYFYPHLHRHKEVQITLIQKGEGMLTVGNNEHRFNDNEIYFIGADVPHVFKSAPSYFTEGNTKEVRALTIHFNAGGRLSNFFNLPELKSLDSFFKSNCSGFRIPLNAFDEISGHILNVRSAAQLEQLFCFFELLRSLQALKDLSPLSCETPLKSPAINYDAVRMDNICSYILNNYHLDLTLESIADCAHMTPQSFCRYFKKHTRSTFISFLNEIRINEACKKLLSGCYDSIAEVAADCGYANITNFNRVFKAVIGQSPSSYVHTSSN
jgi:AraC-like DNA-binding protein